MQVFCKLECTASNKIRKYTNVNGGVWSPGVSVLQVGFWKIVCKFFSQCCRLSLNVVRMSIPICNGMNIYILLCA